ncbi:flagellar motor protein MotB [Winogradskyella damuponensis]|uniref:OmpA-like domain-containing protein n=1 Tax=Winogradskyella damuponensis TaxID=943939 RepID=A0ABP8CSJ4_9FLAO
MSKKDKGDFFWVSYADLMTTLFFVMLVLFVLTVVYLKLDQQKMATTLEDLKKIVQLEEQFKPLEEDGDFIYLEECKKFVAKNLRGIEIFDPGKSEVLEQHKQTTIEIGEKIKGFLEKLQNDNKDFSYLLVIEGNMANTYDKRYSKNNSDGYKKSYERALAVYDLWLDNNINFRKDNVEVLISGSGYNGLCRESRSIGNYKKSEDVESYNKRFSIQIIPKVTNKYE